MRGLITIGVAISILAFASAAEAVRGVVIHERSGCDGYVVDVRTGFALLKRAKGDGPHEGDELTGYFESNGLISVQNLTTGSSSVGIVIHRSSSRLVIIVESYAAQCLYEARMKEVPATAEGLYVA